MLRSRLDPTHQVPQAYTKKKKTDVRRRGDEGKNEGTGGDVRLNQTTERREDADQKKEKEDRLGVGKNQHSAVKKDGDDG